MAKSQQMVVMNMFSSSDTSKTLFFYAHTMPPIHLWLNLYQAYPTTIIGVFAAHFAPKTPLKLLIYYLHALLVHE